MTQSSSRSLALSLALAAAAGTAHAQGAPDPRVGLKGGFQNAGEAISNLTLVSHTAKPQGFFNPSSEGDFAFANADLAFRRNFVFQGGYNGIQVWDISNPASPKLRLGFACPGGQGDVSVYGNLMFMSVEETRGRTDCGGAAITDSVSAARFRGVRIFDITNLDKPKQVAAVQTCRGSHTHTLVPDPKDKGTLYVYVSGTSGVRPAGELAGCSGARPEQDPNTSYFRIEVIKVPVANPAAAKIVSMPRIFANAQGQVNGLNPGGKAAPDAQETAETNMCHDITVYPEMGIAAGACSGNGILLDISNPANPKRIGEVSDPNFAYWHSATFNNDGSKVLFTDEWGGGVGPRCQATDRPEWGADAIFSLSNKALSAKPAGYYKLPAAQSKTENCVAHNGSLIPVPGRDIFAQAWYQGGMSVVDFTDPAKPREIAYFDRGPQNDTTLEISGYWSTYWYNGHLVGSEIGRGLDIFELKPSDMLSENEIEAAKSIEMHTFNPQWQTRITWPNTFAVARSYVDQLERDGKLDAAKVSRIRTDLAAAQSAKGPKRKVALNRAAAAIEKDAAGSGDAAKMRTLAKTVRGIA